MVREQVWDWMKGNFLRGKIQTANANYQGLYYPLNYDEVKLTFKHCHQREKHCRKEEKIPSSSWNSWNICYKSVNCMIKYMANTTAKRYFSHQTFILLIFCVFFLNDIIVFYSKDYTEESESQIIYQKNFCTRTATNTLFLNRGHALAFYIFQWKVFKFWTCLNLKSGEIEASNCKLQGVAEVSGSELLNTGSLQHTRVSWWNNSLLLWLLSEFHPSEFTADGFKQSTDRLTGSHKIKLLETEKNEVITLLHNMLYAFVEYTVILKANTPHYWLHLGIYNILYHILLTNVRAFV